MLTFNYTARDSDGQTIKAEVKADSERTAAKLLHNQGLVPLEIKLKDESKRGLFAKHTKRVSAKDKVLFSRQLATLVGAGLPISQALRTVSEQTANSQMQIVIGSVIADIEAGKSLSQAFSYHPQIFNSVFVNMIAAGETSGTLDDALERLANQQEKDAEIRSKVKGALIYPAIVLFVIVGVVIFMLTMVLPQVEQLYIDLKQELPLITSLMLAISRAIINFWWLIILMIAAAVFFTKRYIETESGRKVADQFKISVPLFGKLMMKMYMARFTRTGETLMATGVPMLEMMEISGNAINNVQIKASVDKASVDVKGGLALSDSLSKYQNILPLVPQMINIGEQSGSIDTMMGKAATFYENELDNEIKAISTTIEPLLMVVLAVVAGAMVGAILIPVYGLVGNNLAI